MAKAAKKKQKPLTFNQKFKKLIEERGVKQTDLAAEFGVTNVWISNLTRTSKPSTKLLSKIAEYFGVKGIDLMGDKEKRLLGLH